MSTDEHLMASLSNVQVVLTLHKLRDERDAILNVEIAEQVLQARHPPGELSPLAA